MRKTTVGPLVALEFNEISFDYIKAYVQQGELPNFAALIEKNGLTKTTAEHEYDRLEPWIQWVTCHTGLSFDEHGVFRLGDFPRTKHEQIWEQLEAEGLAVGAVSPMNAANRVGNPAFFMPDPWTDTPTSGGWLFRELGKAVAQTVNDNAQGRITAKSALALLLGAGRYAYPAHYGAYFKDALASRGRPWRRAMVLDRLIATLFEREWSRTKPDFASLFLNGAAFTQHHYMFSSRAYDGERSNPDWYVAPNEDPMLDMFKLYDEIIARVLRLGARVMLITGLHQIPYGQSTYYWRLRDHARTLARWHVPCVNVQPRMTRDFLVTCNDSADAKTAADILRSATANDGVTLFDVDQRGADLFVMLTYPNDVPKGCAIEVGQQRFGDFDKDVAFVAIKNAHHHGVGYFIDTGEHAMQRPASIPLADIKDRMLGALGICTARTREETAEAI